MERTALLESQPNSHNDLKSFIKFSYRESKLQESKPNVRLVFSNNGVVPMFLQEEMSNHNSLLLDDYTRAKGCISHIDDPLWKNICTDLLDMMGPASVLRIWESKLGEFSPQDKTLDLTCKTEETLEFVQQYDFVILGSLRRYFPTLKQLRVKTLST